MASALATTRTPVLPEPHGARNTPRGLCTLVLVLLLSSPGCFGQRGSAPEDTRGAPEGLLGELLIPDNAGDLMGSDVYGDRPEVDILSAKVQEFRDAFRVTIALRASPTLANHDYGCSVGQRADEQHPRQGLAFGTDNASGYPTGVMAQPLQNGIVLVVPYETLAKLTWRSDFLVRCVALVEVSSSANVADQTPLVEANWTLLRLLGENPDGVGPFWQPTIGKDNPCCNVFRAWPGHPGDRNVTHNRTDLLTTEIWQDAAGIHVRTGIRERPDNRSMLRLSHELNATASGVVANSQITFDFGRNRATLAKTGEPVSSSWWNATTLLLSPTWKQLQERPSLNYIDFEIDLSTLDDGFAYTDATVLPTYRTTE